MAQKMGKFAGADDFDAKKYLKSWIADLIKVEEENIAAIENVCNEFFA